MKHKSCKLSDQIRLAVESCEQSRYVIARETGIDQSTLSRFMSSERGLPMKTLDRLADYLNLNVTMAKTRKAKKGK